eukprot:jgi/Hompol1/4528/HPOL_000941-RA
MRPDRAKLGLALFSGSPCGAMVPSSSSSSSSASAASAHGDDHSPTFQVDERSFSWVSPQSVAIEFKGEVNTHIAVIESLSSSNTIDLHWTANYTLPSIPFQINVTETVTEQNRSVSLLVQVPGHIQPEKLRIDAKLVIPSTLLNKLSLNLSIPFGNIYNIPLSQSPALAKSIKVLAGAASIDIHGFNAEWVMLQVGAGNIQFDGTVTDWYQSVAGAGDINVHVAVKSDVESIGAVKIQAGAGLIAGSVAGFKTLSAHVAAGDIDFVSLAPVNGSQTEIWTGVGKVNAAVAAGYVGTFKAQTTLGRATVDGTNIVIDSTKGGIIGKTIIGHVGQPESDSSSFVAGSSAGDVALHFD